MRRSLRAAAAASPAGKCEPAMRQSSTKQSPPAAKDVPTEKLAISSSAAAALSFPHGTLPKSFEDARYLSGFKTIAGVDEAGRGPLAGPVVAAACVVPRDVLIEGIHDSKKLAEPQREALYDALTSHPRVQYAVSIVDHAEIDNINILQASMRAMERAIAALPSAPDTVFVDGPYVPKGLTESLGDNAIALVKGDSRCYSIAAASVIAKVARDRIMLDLHKLYPQYGLDQHKGYPTPAHKEAVRVHGPSPIHRRTFAPLKHWFPLPEKEEAEGQGAEDEPKKSGKGGKKRKRTKA